MRTREQVNEDKLRGGFYSPDVLVDLCLGRAAAMLGDRCDLRVLEPAAGDGAFLRGLGRSGLRHRVGHVEAVELIASEAAQSKAVLAELQLPGRAVHANVLGWAQDGPTGFDLVLANPPYVRFQFIAEEDRQRAKAIAARLGTATRSVANLWIPVLLLALDRLGPGGVFSVILPTEFLTGVSASAVRSWLLTHTTELTIDLFRPGSFPAVLQEVLVLTGRRAAPRNPQRGTVRFHDHGAAVGAPRGGGPRSWSHTVDVGVGTWTSFLLAPEQHRALTDVQAIGEIRQVTTLARFTVSTVTGANGYFCLPREQVDEHGLGEWAVPLLPRVRHARGLVFDVADAQAVDRDGLPAWLVSFAADTSSPEDHPGARGYLERGRAQGIDRRFKCRVRSPWYRVPVVPPGDLLLSKRSNRFPRVIANHAGVVTTDTIYRGRMLPGAPVTADDFTATFHNSLTLLSAEIEGRSFGGGVLELVPSEVGALRVPLLPGAGDELPRLDAIARQATDPEDLVAATDQLLARRLPALGPDLLDALEQARQTLLARRLERT